MQENEMEILIDDARVAEVAKLGLKAGGHKRIADGMCAMEAASYIAGEPWSDHPECVCPVIAAFLRNWNDSLDTEDRNRLITPALIVKTIGTRGSKELEKRRSLMAADWLIRTHAPAWLRLAKLDAQADLIAGLPEITDMAQYPSLRAPLEAVRKDAAAAWDAAGDAAWDAAGDAAWDAARAAAWDAAWDAAGDAAWDAARAAAWDAAWDAARDAAGDAARAAAWDAAWDAAGDALKPTQTLLQASAGELIERMCAATEEKLAA
jgi:hypothetical protein